MKKNIRVGLVCQLANSHDVGQQTVRGIVTNKDSNLFQHQMVCRKKKAEGILISGPMGTRKPQNIFIRSL